MLLPCHSSNITIVPILELMKATPESNPDRACLDKAHRAIADVLANINNRKRKADGCLAIFKLLHQIEDCPPVLLNANREVVATFENLNAVPNLNWNEVNSKQPVVIYLLNDCIEICKKKKSGGLLSPLVSKRPRTTTVTLGSSSLCVPQSPAKGTGVFHHQPANGPSNRTNCYEFKHMLFMPLDFIQRVVDITDAAGDVFGIISVDSSNNHRKIHALYTFEASETASKKAIINTIAKQLAKCSRPANDLIGQATTYELGMNGPNSLAPTSAGVTKTPSMKKRGGEFVRRMSRIVTQTPGRLTRGMSSILSPAVRQFTSSSAMTPAGDLFCSPSKNSLNDECSLISGKENLKSNGRLPQSTSAILCPTPHMHGAFDGGIGATSLAEIEDENSN